MTFSSHIGAKVEEVEPGLSVLALVGVRMATIQMNVHFLGAVSEGRITCKSEVLHRARRRTATAEVRVHDSDGNLVALGTGAFGVFESRGNAIVQGKELA